MATGPPNPRRRRRRRVGLPIMAAVIAFLATGLVLSLVGEPAAVDVAADDAAPGVAPTPTAQDAPAPEAVTAAPATPTAPPLRPDPTPTPLQVLPPTDPVALVRLPAVPPYEPDPGDVEADAKRLASRFVQSVLTYEVGATPAAVAATVAGEHDLLAPPLAGAIHGVVHPDVQSTGEVVYPQMGGLTADAASVMVVVRQRMLDLAGAERVEVRTIDVRLRRDAAGWRIEELASDGGPVTPRPADLPPEAARVLDHPGIELPDSARWDIHRGEIRPELLTRMAEIADRHPIKVAVLVAGHPYHVFGTSNRSRHMVGGAVDIYAVDGVLVVNDRVPGGTTHGLSRWLYDSGTPNLGSPWAFDGVGGRSFTDAVHQDHLHVSA